MPYAPRKPYSLRNHGHLDSVVIVVAVRAKTPDSLFRRPPSLLEEWLDDRVREITVANVTDSENLDIEIPTGISLKSPFERAKGEFKEWKMDRGLCCP